MFMRLHAVKTYFSWMGFYRKGIACTHFPLTTSVGIKPDTWAKTGNFSLNDDDGFVGGAVGLGLMGEMLEKIGVLSISRCLSQQFGVI